MWIEELAAEVPPTVIVITVVLVCFMLFFFWFTIFSKARIASLSALVICGILAVGTWQLAPPVYRTGDAITSIENTYQVKVLEINKRAPDPESRLFEASPITIEGKDGKVMIGCHIKTVADQQRLMCDNTEPVVPAPR